MNLTQDQKNLLGLIATEYQNGTGGRSFIFIRTRDGTSVLFGNNKNIAVRVHELDFQQLASEGLLTLRTTTGGAKQGAITQKGLDVVEKNFASNSPPSLTKARPIDELSQPTKQKENVVFIGHGRAKDWLELRHFLQEDLGVRCIEFNSGDPVGQSTKERLEEMLNEATFAFLVMTAEDEHSDGKHHARANVIHEVGLFQGKLGFKKAILLVEEGCAEFSNIHGLTHISFRKGDIEGAFHKVQKKLISEGVIAR